MVDKYRIDFGINSYMLLESEYGDLVKLKDYEQLEAENKRLRECLNDIQSQCVGEIAMGYKLDAEDLGRMVYEKTGIKQGLGWKP